MSDMIFYHKLYSLEEFNTFKRIAPSDAVLDSGETFGEFCDKFRNDLSAKGFSIFTIPMGEGMNVYLVDNTSKKIWVNNVPANRENFYTKEYLMLHSIINAEVLKKELAKAKFEFVRAVSTEKDFLESA